MSTAVSGDMKRLTSSIGVYAFASFAQKGLAFLLIPIYTRHIDTSEYGVLELLSAFSTIFFGVLGLGLASALMKCFHRDCKDEQDQERILATAAVVALPVLLIGGGVAIAFAEPLSRMLFGGEGSAGLVRLVSTTGILSSLTFLTLSELRAEERSAAYSTVVLLQFLIAGLLNILFVVKFEMGIRGVLWGNLASYIGALPVAVMLASRRSRFAVSPALVRPLLAFGLLMVPGVLTGWVNNLSDRYILRLLTDLDQVAIYGIGYKFGTVIRLVVVWPFQLAWPAFAFAISDREDHKSTYAHTLTYLAAVLAFSVLGLSILSREMVPWVVGDAYREAYRVVPLVALSYAFSGIFFCLNPGVHIAGKTRYFPLLSALTAALNVCLNFLLIPRFGMMGAAAATASSFFAGALGAWVLAQRFYPVEYEYGRLLKIVAAGILTWVIATRVPATGSLPSWLWNSIWATLGFPVFLVATRFFTVEEWDAIRRRLQVLLGRVRRSS